MLSDLPKEGSRQHNSNDERIATVGACEITGRLRAVSFGPTHRWGILEFVPDLGEDVEEVGELGRG